MKFKCPHCGFAHLQPPQCAVRALRAEVAKGISVQRRRAGAVEKNWRRRSGERASHRGQAATAQVTAAQLTSAPVANAEMVAVVEIELSITSAAEAWSIPAAGLGSVARPDRPA